MKERCNATDKDGAPCSFVAGHGGNHSFLWCWAQGRKVRFEQPDGESVCYRRFGHDGEHRYTLPPFYRHLPDVMKSADAS